MKYTKHIKNRMNQRAINQDLIELTVNYGEMMNDGKIILTKKTIKKYLQALTNIQRQVQKAYEKGGIVVVSEGEALITTYRLESFQKNKNQDLGVGE